MRKFGSLTALYALVLFTSAPPLSAQTPSPAPSPVPDPAITALSVTGVVSDVKTDPRQVIVTTAAGNQVTVTLSDRTVFMRIPASRRSFVGRDESWWSVNGHRSHG